MRRVLRSVTRSWRDAPATIAWLLTLLVTTRVQRSAGRQRAHLLAEQSTNLHHLEREPVRVLAASLFWLDDRRWWPYVAPFLLVLAPAERRMGTTRWLLVGLAAHVAGTYIGQGYLRRSIETEQAPAHLARARDVGVSYFALGIAGAVTTYAPKRFRWALRILGVGALTANAVARPTFTEVGHLSAFVAGMGVGSIPESAVVDGFSAETRQ